MTRNSGTWSLAKAVHGSAYLMARTRKTGFAACMAMGHMVEQNGDHVETQMEVTEKKDYVSNRISLELGQGEEVILYKFVSVLTSMNHQPEDLVISAVKTLAGAMAAGFDGLFEEHVKVWDEKWAHSDIVIEGDTAAQQGIRFNIFQLNQTYTGKDERLNIGPKGFTGEKYGGSTYWDTEAYMIPFYLSTAPQEVSRNLLVYRYKHLGKAIENARKLGFTGGAALYPMVTMNGEECHNEWEITFEEIHRNGAIAYAIYNYIRYTGDQDYLADFGLEVLIGISRFWRQRITWSEAKKKYVMLGVTGPNEYENNVNNNWYTNKMACLDLVLYPGGLQFVKKNHAGTYETLVKKTHFDPGGRAQGLARISRITCISPWRKRAGSSCNRMGSWTKNSGWLRTWILRSVPSISTGRGTASCVPALSNRPMSCRVFLYLRMSMTGRPWSAISIFTNRARSMNPRFPPVCIPSWLPAWAGVTKPTKCTCGPPVLIWMITTMKCMKGSISPAWGAPGCQ
jgi:hypothetical protein